MNGKREFWQMIAMAAVMSGRKTNAEAAAAADELAKAYADRVKQWDAEEGTKYEQWNPGQGTERH